ncbi:MAG: flagellar hook protein FlgE [Firmicutes bacterium]|nr:flagellar hook protein FlgE [Bacillota bacterium]
MIRSLSTAVSGLRGHQIKLDVIGNNIANVNTVAFKKSQARFEDLLSQTMQGATAPMMRGGMNPSQVGMGMRVSSILNNHYQGPIQNTDWETDLAIEGSGYFIVSDGREYFYTRDGSFGQDSSGHLVNVNGLRLMGWPGTEESTRAELAPLHIPLGEQAVARATSQISFAGNLDARAIGEDHAGEYSYSYEHFVFDSLGHRYFVEVVFIPDEENTWTFEISSDDLTITEGSSGKLKFTPEGNLDIANSEIDIFKAAPAGALPLDITLNFQGCTQLAGLSNLLVRDQNGFPTGELVSFEIGRSGMITGTYSNGMVENIGQIPLAFFTNPEGLIKEGGNLYQVTSNSGEARAGLPGTEGRGLIRSSSLEMSNADIAVEFTELITTSRAFQANTRVVTASDEILMEVINMKR